MYLAEEIEKRTGFETRLLYWVTFSVEELLLLSDRVLGTRFGVFAAELVEQGKWGYMSHWAY